MLFVKITSETMQLDIPLVDRIVLGYLQGFGKGKPLKIRNETISKELNISLRQVERSLKSLKDKSLIDSRGRGTQRVLFCSFPTTKIGSWPTTKIGDCQPPNLAVANHQNWQLPIYTNNNTSIYKYTDSYTNNYTSKKNNKVNKTIERVNNRDARAHDDNHVDDIVNRLAAFYPAKWSKLSEQGKADLFKVWRETFKAEDSRDLEKAFVSYTSQNKFFPFPNEFAKLVQLFRNEREINEREEVKTNQEPTDPDLLADIEAIFQEFKNGGN